MAEKITKNLYGGEVQIDFYPNSHRYKLNGSRSYLISVTSATGIIDKSRALIPWAVNLAGSHLRQYLEESSVNSFSREELYPIIDEALVQHTKKKEEAAAAGSLVHAWAEQFARFKLGLTEKMPELTEDMDEKVILGINAFLGWYNSHKVVFKEVERMIYSKNYEYVGLTDIIAEVDGRTLIMDYKTSKGVYNEMFYQVSAYWGGYEEETGKLLDGGALLHFSKETGEFSIHEFTREEHEKNYKTFLACLEIKKREKELTKY